MKGGGHATGLRPLRRDLTRYASNTRSLRTSVRPAKGAGLAGATRRYGPEPHALARSLSISWTRNCTARPGELPVTA